MIFREGEQVTPVKPEQPQPQLPALPAKWIFLLKSRKFWAALVGLGLIIFRAYDPDFPINDDQLTKAILLLIAYIIGTAFEDGKGATWPKP